MKRKQMREKTINRVLLGLIVSLLAVIIVNSVFYLRSSRPAVQAKKETVEIARKCAGLEGTDHFYQPTRKKAYFSLIGTNDEEKEIAVIIPKSGEEVKVLGRAKGLTKGGVRQAIAAVHPETRIEKATLGICGDQSVQEVIGRETNGGLNYYLIGFESGDEVKTTKGI